MLRGWTGDRGQLIRAVVRKLSCVSVAISNRGQQPSREIELPLLAILESEDPVRGILRQRCSHVSWRSGNQGSAGGG